jgi:hypothetical protein
MNRKDERRLLFCPDRSAKVRMNERRRASKDIEEMDGQIQHVAQRALVAA